MKKRKKKIKNMDILGLVICKDIDILYYDHLSGDYKN